MALILGMNVGDTSALSRIVGASEDATAAYSNRASATAALQAEFRSFSVFCSQITDEGKAADLRPVAWWRFTHAGEIAGMPEPGASGWSAFKSEATKAYKVGSFEETNDVSIPTDVSSDTSFSAVYGLVKALQSAAKAVESETGVEVEPPLIQAALDADPGAPNGQRERFHQIVHDLHPETAEKEYGVDAKAEPKRFRASTFVRAIREAGAVPDRLKSITAEITAVHHNDEDGIFLEDGPMEGVETMLRAIADHIAVRRTLEAESLDANASGAIAAAIADANDA